MEEFKQNILKEQKQKKASKKEGKTTVQKIKRSIRNFFLYMLLLAIIVAAGAYYIANRTFSEGNRAGYLIKVSNKGFFVKTMEGQMNLGGIASGEMSAIVQNNMWEFSVDNDSIFRELQKYEGKQIKVHYIEKNKSMPWQGTTNYFITEVNLVN